MLKINPTTVIVNPLTGNPVPTSAGPSLTLREIVTMTLNQPPTLFKPDGSRNARQTAELRMSIVRKMNSGDDGAYLLPEERDEILSCIATIQPPVIFEGVRELLERVELPLREVSDPVPETSEEHAEALA
jgi:hypothetical protein